MTDHEQLTLARAAVTMDETGGRLGWLACLISSYEDAAEELEASYQLEGRDPWDTDPAASSEMLRECRALLDGLRKAFPRPEPIADPEARPSGSEEIPF